MTEPLMKAFFDLEAELTERVSQMSVTRLNDDQKPFYQECHHLRDPDIALKDAAIRTKQLALHGDRLYRTPLEIAQKIDKKDVVVFWADYKALWCVGTKWDFTPIYKDSRLEYYNLTPAKGPGGTWMYVNSLSLEGKSGCPVLKALFKEIEALTGFTFKVSDFPDC